jgi:hypothetical protein
MILGRSAMRSARCRRASDQSIALRSPDREFVASGDASPFAPRSSSPSAAHDGAHSRTRRLAVGGSPPLRTSPVSIATTALHGWRERAAAHGHRRTCGSIVRRTTRSWA